MVAQRDDIEASTIQCDLKGLIERIETLNIDMIALIAPEAVFVEEVEKCLQWLRGKGERTSQNLHIVPAQSSAVRTGTLFQGGENANWQLYVWHDYLFCKQISATK